MEAWLQLEEARVERKALDLKDGLVRPVSSRGRGRHQSRIKGSLSRDGTADTHVATVTVIDKQDFSVVCRQSTAIFYKSLSPSLKNKFVNACQFPSSGDA
ncbi:unnamed protein product [Chondrus crispus]|uniref:Uncharacterized protein n=1 Tax=Chondrus crispus TaxID=2769 RepID=R7Q7N7_CHOCR|nr:unnamed protein product [Chondrus crispus]CDF34547.1 unnamed protein product [Chondrus crispus]|eukprot:XP_005714366.1 unnamed protein product [Chondrus crispus]